MRSSDGPPEPERNQPIRDAPDETSDAHRPLLLPGASALGLSLIAHALVIGAAIWLIGVPKMPAREKPIRVSLLAPGASGPAQLSASHSHAPPAAAARIEMPRRLHRTRIHHVKRVVRARPIVRPTESAVASRPPAPTMRPPAGGANAAASSKLPSGAGEGASGAGFANVGPVPAGSVAHPPRLLERVMPRYPIRARVRGVTGRVVVEVVLGRDGGIRRIRVIHSVALLDRAAIRAVSRWRFSPARNANGTPVSVIVDIPVVFKLQD